MKRNILLATSGVLIAVSLIGCRGEGDSNGATTTTVPKIVVAAPSNVSAAPDKYWITISWGAVNGATAYNIYWSPTSGVTKANGVKIARASSPYRHDGLAKGVACYYVVTAENSDGESAASAQVSATPLGGDGLSGAVITGADGNAALDINGGQNIVFKFIDAATLKPVAGLAVGFGIDPESRAVGALMVIDPSKNHYPQIIVLQGKGEAAAPENPLPRFMHPKNSAPPPEELDWLQVLLPKGPQTTVGTFIMDKLDLVSRVKEVDKMLKVIDGIVLAGKIVDTACGGAVGDWAGKLTNSEVKYLTQDEAKAEIIADAKESALQTLGFYMSGTAIPLDPRSVLLDLATLAGGPLLDYSTVIRCGSPEERIRVVKIYKTFTSYACRPAPMDREVALVHALVDGKDNWGLPLSQGSLELFSKANIGVGFKAALDSNGEAEIEVPVDNYDAVVSSPGFNPKKESISVTSQGASLNTTLQSAATFTGNTYTGPFSGVSTQTVSFNVAPVSCSAQWRDTFNGTIRLIVSGSGTLIDPYVGSMRFDCTGDQAVVYCTCPVGCGAAGRWDFTMVGAVTGSQGKVEASALETYGYLEYVGDGYFSIALTGGTISGNTLTGTFTIKFSTQDAPLIKTVTLTR